MKRTLYEGYEGPRLSPATQMQRIRRVIEQELTVKQREIMLAYYFQDKSIPEIEREFAGKGYGDFKIAVGEATADALAPVQTRFAELMADKAALEAQMKRGAEEASYYARRTLSKIQKKLGFVQIR